MKSTITFLWVFAYLLTGFSVNGQSSLFGKADSLLASGYKEDASLAYDHVIYLNKGNEVVLAEGLLKKTACLKQQKKYDRIESLLRRIDVNTLSDSFKAVVYYELALGSYLSDKHERAEQEILPVFNLDISSNELLLASAILYVHILNETGQWKQAHIVLNEFISANAVPEEKEKLLKASNEFYAAGRIPRLKSIKKARNLSLIFPGLGQAYNRDYLKALESFSFVSHAVIYIAYNIINTTYFTAATAGVYGFLYFYYGGAGQANTLVPYKNYRKKLKYNNYLRSNLTMLVNELRQ